jgi:hypothetical protein
VDASVEFASFDNLRELEARRAFRWSGKRMAPGDKADPDSYKVRRAKVGGYRDYFDEDQVRQINSYVQAKLGPGFGYEITDGK